MVDLRRQGIVADEILHGPLQDHEGDTPIAEIPDAIALLGLQLEHLRIEFGAAVDVAAAQGDVVDITLLLPVILGENVLRLARIALGEIEDDHIGIMGAHRRIGPLGRPHHPLQRGVEGLHALQGELHALHLEAEVIEAAAPTLATGDVVEADLPIAHGHGAGGARIAGALHAEQRHVEAGVRGVEIAGDRDVIDFGEHAFRPRVQSCRPHSPSPPHGQDGASWLAGPPSCMTARHHRQRGRPPT